MSGLNLTAACRRGMKQDRERAKLIARNENKRRVVFGYRRNKSVRK